ncbi:MAG: flagellar assembly protein FliX [Rhodospirillales bacterium]
MKVSKVGSPKDAAGVKKKKAAAKDGAFAESLRGAFGAAADSPHAVEPTGKAGAVDSVFALQEVPDAVDRRSRGLLRQHGEDLLSRLDELRISILAGAVPKERLTQLAQRLRQKRQESDDPKLNEIIEEIELRAEVEIAKLTRDR